MSKIDLAKHWQAHVDRFMRQAKEAKTNEEYRRCIHDAFRLKRRITILLTGDEPV